MKPTVPTLPAAASERTAQRRAASPQGRERAIGRALMTSRSVRLSACAPAVAGRRRRPSGSRPRVGHESSAIGATARCAGCMPVACSDASLQDEGFDDDAEYETAHQRNPRLPGRGHATAAPDGALLVREQGDLPARAGVERLRRRRQAALRSDDRRGAVRERSRSEDSRQLRRAGAHDHRVRQRHRHVAPGSHRAHRHDRQVGHARVLRAAHRRIAPRTRISSDSSASASTPPSSSPTASR